jgi:hypothetical protein
MVRPLCTRVARQAMTVAAGSSGYKQLLVSTFQDMSNLLGKHFCHSWNKSLAGGCRRIVNMIQIITIATKLQ